MLVVVLGLVITVNTGGSDDGESTASGGNSTASGGGASSPAEAVKSYLEALAAGDAEKALSYQKGEPVSKELLTDEVLQKQIAKMPITDIRILDGADEQSDKGIASVHAAAKFGDNLSDAMIITSKIDGSWKLDGVVKLTVPPPIRPEGSRNTLTLFGKPVLKTAAPYVFPGYLDFASTNPNITVAIGKPVLLEDLSLDMGYPRLQYALNRQGQDAAMQAVADAFAACERSHSIRPPGCPQWLQWSAIDGTVQWGRTDLRAVALGSFMAERMTVNVSGVAHTPVTFQSESGQTVTEDNSKILYNSIDMAKEPPVFIWDEHESHDRRSPAEAVACGSTPCRCAGFVDNVEGDSDVVERARLCDQLCRVGQADAGAVGLIAVGDDVRRREASTEAGGGPVADLPPPADCAVLSGCLGHFHCDDSDFGVEPPVLGGLCAQDGLDCGGFACTRRAGGDDGGSGAMARERLVEVVV